MLIAENATSYASDVIQIDYYEEQQANTYDASNQRARKVGDADERLFIYGPGGELLSELDSSGNTLVEYVYLEGEPLAQVHGSGGTAETYYVHNSHLGAPEALTNGSQSVVWNIQTEPFGDSYLGVSGPSEAPPSQNLRFPGQYSDEATRVSYNWHRYYDPSIGRYISADPIGQAGGVNLYTYALSNPANLIDPNGLDVTVTLYPGAGGFGHVGIGVNTDQTVGLYPAPDASTVATATGRDVPGDVRPDTRAPEATVTIPTTPAQDAAIQAAINARDATPGNYNLVNDNCAGFVQDALGAGGIPTSGTTFPRSLVRELQGAGAGGRGDQGNKSRPAGAGPGVP